MSELTVGEFMDKFESWAPPYLAVEGDPIGLHFGSRKQKVKRLMVTLDVRPAVVEEAREKNVDLLFAHHPPIFRAPNTLRDDQPQEKMYADILRQNLAVYAAHTNLDTVTGGMNDWLAEQYGFSQLEILAPHGSTNRGKEAEAPFGMGRVGQLKTPMPIEDYAQLVKEKSGTRGLRMVLGRPHGEVKRVAVLGGSGQKYYEAARLAGADTFITADLTYHFAHDMEAWGLNALDPGHYMEQVVKASLLPRFEAWREEENWPIEILMSTINTDPFYFI